MSDVHFTLNCDTLLSAASALEMRRFSDIILQALMRSLAQQLTSVFPPRLQVGGLSAQQRSRAGSRPHTWTPRMEPETIWIWALPGPEKVCARLIIFIKHTTDIKEITLEMSGRIKNNIANTLPVSHQEPLRPQSQLCGETVPGCRQRRRNILAQQKIPPPREPSKHTELCFTHTGHTHCWCDDSIACTAATLPVTSSFF